MALRVGALDALQEAVVAVVVVVENAIAESVGLKLHDAADVGVAGLIIQRVLLRCALALQVVGEGGRVIERVLRGQQVGQRGVVGVGGDAAQGVYRAGHLPQGVVGKARHAALRVSYRKPVALVVVFVSRGLTCLINQFKCPIFKSYSGGESIPIVTILTPFFINSKASLAT